MYTPPLRDDDLKKLGPHVCNTRRRPDGVMPSPAEFLPGTRSVSTYVYSRPRTGTCSKGWRNTPSTRIYLHDWRSRLAFRSQRTPNDDNTMTAKQNQKTVCVDKTIILDYETWLFVYCTDLLVATS
jgi:hypothetical protein